MFNAIEIATMAFAFFFYASLIVKQHITNRDAECEKNPEQISGEDQTATSGNTESI